ncbi:hypothetical protein VTL71DRAFT_16252 [Oculimacula yallundae]|uniref:Uncharacterized protein n=1 Tax=Oculimacula yallundae TaxID=86028 RepID=A0ABR4CDX4_9HELO
MLQIHISDSFTTTMDQQCYINFPAANDTDSRTHHPNQWPSHAEGQSTHQGMLQSSSSGESKEGARRCIELKLESEGKGERSSLKCIEQNMYKRQGNRYSHYGNDQQSQSPDHSLSTSLAKFVSGREIVIRHRSSRTVVPQHAHRSRILHFCRLDTNGLLALAQDTSRDTTDNDNGRLRALDSYAQGADEADLHLANTNASSGINLRSQKAGARTEYINLNGIAGIEGDGDLHKRLLPI